jgi:hypothetical protein
MSDFKDPYWWVVRDGLWCDRCMTSSRVEQDVRTAGALVVTLEGCVKCRTGLCAEPDHVEEQHAPTCALVTTHSLTCTCGAYTEARNGQ